MNPLEAPLQTIIDRINAEKPILVSRMGATALYFINENFEKQGFQAETFQPWQKRKKDKDPGRPVLLGKGTGHLRRSPFVSYSDAEKIIITSSLPYSKIHNEGGTITHPYREVTLHYSKDPEGKLLLRKIQTQAQQRKISEIRTSSISQHTTTMPKRQFLGPSPILNKRIKEMLATEVAALFHIIK